MERHVAQRSVVAAALPMRPVEGQAPAAAAEEVKYPRPGRQPSAGVLLVVAVVVVAMTDQELPLLSPKYSLAEELSEKEELPLALLHRSSRWGAVAVPEVPVVAGW